MVFNYHYTLVGEKRNNILINIQRDVSVNVSAEEGQSSRTLKRGSFTLILQQ